MYIHSTGGIGNQLFQYNLAHLLNVNMDRKAIILFEDSSNSKFPRNNFLVDIEKVCNHDVSVIEESKLLLVIKARDSIKYRTGLRSNSQKEQTFVERLKSINNNQKQKAAPFIFRELWQDWELVNAGFPLIEHEILKWLDGVKFDNNVSQILKREFQTIHVRRGDYSLNPDAWGLLSIEYYKMNIQDDLFTVIVTDDDPLTGKLRTEFPEAQVFGPKELDELQALKIMSISRRIIVANSSFSWWGSVLAREFSGAEVIMPDTWYKRSDRQPSLLGDPRNEYRKAIFE